MRKIIITINGINLIATLGSADFVLGSLERSTPVFLVVKK